MVKEVLVEVCEGHLVPATADARLWASELDPGERFVVRLMRERNAAHHRKFFSLVNWVAANHAVYDTTAKALDAVKLATGHVAWVPHPETGEVIPIPKSISFDNMGQDEFDVFYSDAIGAVLAHLAPDIENYDEFVAEVARY